MEEKKVSTLFEEMKDDLAGYVTNSLRLFKLQTFSKASKFGALLLYAFAIVLLILFALNLVFTTLAIYLGELLDSMSLGFAIVSLFAIFVVIVTIMLRKSIKNGLINIIVSFLMDDDKE